MASFKRRLKEFVPPILVRAIKKRVAAYGFFGNFATWEEAMRCSSGYDHHSILEKVKEAALKVQRGEAAYERDSVTFDKIEYPFPVLAGLLRAAGKKPDKLTILDFGGSLGSKYFQCRPFLTPILNLQWCIVEQKHYVNCGNQFFADSSLKFFRSVDDVIQDTKPDVFLCSSTIQYLPEPYAFLDYVLDKNIPSLIFDMTAIIRGQPDRLTLQKVPPNIYKASYPAWFLNEEKFLSQFSGKYNLISDFDALGTWDLGDVVCQNKGYIFESI